MPPQPMMCSAKGRYAKFDELTGPGFVILGDNCDPAGLLTSSERTAWDKLGARYLAVRSTNLGSEADSDIIDLEGTLLAWMRKHNTSAMIMRPDRFVMADDRSGLDLPILNSW